MQRTILFLRSTLQNLSSLTFGRVLRIPKQLCYQDSSAEDFMTHVQIGDSGFYYDEYLYVIVSEVLDAAEIKEYAESMNYFSGYWITATDAYNMVMAFYDDDTGINVSDILNVDKDDLKKQCAQDIVDLGEAKAHSIGLKDSPTQDETDYVDAFLTNRSTRLSQYETDKTTWGFDEE